MLLKYTVQDSISSLPAQELICAVNVNHNCAAHQCKITPTRQVIQERRKTVHFENEVNHAVESDDCFLNLAQLRSATDVQKFRNSAQSPDLSLADAIEQAIRNKDRLEREAKEAEEIKETERQDKQAKAAEKALKQPQEKSKSKGSKSGTQAGQGPGGAKKRKRVVEEVDRDFAEGGEELLYHPRPSKSRAVQPE